MSQMNSHPWSISLSSTLPISADAVEATREGKMFVPDVMVPSQFFARRDRDKPEYRLLLAVLENAVDDITKPSHKPKNRQAAIDWFDDETGSARISFLMICDAFGFEPTM